MEGLYTLLGLYLVYLWVHFVIIQFKRSWKERSGYERYLTIAAIVTVFITLWGLVE
jgi:type VI protein secretion system component VasK